ncbi:MAG: hypothetical protein QM704_12445 [Anaeromyxobacteraceae bacterium]
MKSVNDIVRDVETLLDDPSGAKQVAAVVEYLERLIALEDDRLEQLPGIRRRKGMLFFSTTGKLLRPKATLDVRINGRFVGDVALSDDGARTFRPAKEWRGDWPRGERIDWADPRVLGFLRARERDLPRKDLEAKVQSALFHAMRQKRGPKKLEELRHNQPVQMARQPFQFPLPIAASGATPMVAKAPALGHADILARGHAGHRIKVFEIKRRGGDARHALAQGVAYAAAIQRLLTVSAVTYRALGFRKARSRAPRFEVWAFVHEDDVGEVLASGKDLVVANDHYDLHVLTYRLEGDQPLTLGAPIAVGKAQSKAGSRRAS